MKKNKLFTKLLISLVAYVPCMWFGFVMNISMRYLGLSSVLSYVGLFVFYPLAYGMIWFHDRQKVVRSWCIFMGVFAAISIFIFIMFVPVDNEVKQQFIQLFI